MLEPTLSACHPSLVRGILGGVSLKVTIIPLLFLGVGFVVGLPMGAADGRRASAKAEEEKAAVAKLTGEDENSSARGSSKKKATADDNSLLARLLAIYESETNEGRTSYWTDFDARVAELLNGCGTAELSALAVQFSQAKTNPAPPEVLRAVFMHWARRDAGAAWQGALAALPNHRAEALAGCLLAMSATDHLAALKRVDAITDESMRKDAKKILNDTAERYWQPEALTRRLLAMPESERPKDLLKKTIISWASQHLRTALDFVKTLPQKEREKVLPDFCMALGYFDGEEARRLAASIQDPKLSAEAWKWVVWSYQETNPDEAMSLMESLPLEQMDASFFDARANLYFPAEAAGRIASRLTGKSRENLLSQVFKSAFLVNGRQLQAQLDAIELQPEDGPAIKPVMRRMMKYTPDSALAWADSLPESPLRDHVMAEASDAIGEHDRQRALQMAAGVQDEKLRVTTMRSQMESWLQNNRTAAIAWLKSAEEDIMPAEERSRWLRLYGAK